MEPGSGDAASGHAAVAPLSPTGAACGSWTLDSNAGDEAAPEVGSLSAGFSCRPRGSISTSTGTTCASASLASGSGGAPGGGGLGALGVEQRRLSYSPTAAATAQRSASPKMLERVQQYGEGRRAMSGHERGHDSSADEVYLQAKLKYHRAVAQARVQAQASSTSFALPSREDSMESCLVDMLHPPTHVLPPAFFIRLPFNLGDGDGADEGRQSSLGFIFTVCNTMMGATLMTLPWGFQSAGLLTGAVLTVIFGIVAFYTSSLILDWGLCASSNPYEDFGDLCEAYLGRWAKQLANLTSVVIITGAAACYHVLMATNVQAVTEALAAASQTEVHFFCCGDGNFQYAFASLLVGACLLPLLMVRDVAKLAAVGSYGVLALLYNVAFLVLSSFLAIFEVDRSTWGSVKLAGSVDDVGVFVGMMGVSLFVHSVLLPIAAGHSKVHSAPGVVKRDLGIAYALAVLFYVIVGMVPAAAFELRRWQELPQNVLLADNFSAIGALVGRSALVLQIGIVYPILAAVMRRQLFGGLLGRPELGPRGMALYGLALVGLTTTVSAVYPKPGSVVGYVGTYTAVVYVLWLPILVHLAAVRKSGQRLGLTLLLHGGMAVVGTVVLLMQFVV
eukprot:TRINITY_DN588_c0_g1_i2.p1 TRINITY_DN588_c0_g1~~TRINITY_DN588_c0_g1_i2.p1  ORF type:complete len:618 (-),score=151.85 TRINITY_DN588_c0_g1_i2:159-2012(-)